MSYTRLRYHFVWATKYRRRWITPEVEHVLEKATLVKAREIGVFVFEHDGIDEHRHVIAGVPPSLTIASVARRLKAAGTRAVHKELGLTDFAWQEGYSCHSLNALDFNDACRYVREQKQRHDRLDLIVSYESVGDE